MGPGWLAATRRTLESSIISMIELSMGLFLDCRGQQFVQGASAGERWMTPPTKKGQPATCQNSNKAGEIKFQTALMLFRRSQQKQIHHLLSDSRAYLALKERNMKRTTQNIGTALKNVLSKQEGSYL